ncbi:Similar to COP9 signalosome complex subunit 2; acc. no. Q5B3U7 [Pyronema omphalodes CBS 100304]|uniref:COP9 signalosome complex subunit 2 n=1 Tax=Pyronema omphalodes (strain CBS 100304) TaxID=1076935 RepID=U4KWM1_PYROM|nr:Similar to COP9 signalosome complex subunit 2; acc. no. Q5B3U7 [Pyronema omphalodes CBS 100304]
MSDDDFMLESDNEDYEFDYEDNSEEESPDVDIENRYYNAKQMKATDPQAAINEFLEVVKAEKEKGDWGFKGLKQAIKLEFKMKQLDKAIEHYEELLTYIKSAVTRNYSEKSINNMLDYISSSNDTEDMPCMEKFYDLTLNAFTGTNNERLWLKTNIKLAKLWLDRKEYARLTRNVRTLYKACQKSDGSDDPSKGTYLLEVYAIEIQMYSELSNNQKLKDLFKAAQRVRSAVPHPKIMGIIRECGGKMHMSQENWEEANSDFFESFRNYDEAGSLQRIQVLKYLVLAAMLMKTKINPFESQETKPYRSDPRIIAMTDLVEAYQHNDIHRYEAILEKNKDEILSDPFIRMHIDEVTRNIRTEALLKLIKPFTRFTLEFIAKQLRISIPEVTEILGFLILDKKVNGKINQAKGTVQIESTTDAEMKVKAIQEWTRALEKVTRSMFNDPGSEGGKLTIEDPSVSAAW